MLKTMSQTETSQTNKNTNSAKTYLCFDRIPGGMNEYLIDEGLDINVMREKVIRMIETSETYELRKER